MSVLANLRVITKLLLVFVAIIGAASISSLVVWRGLDTVEEATLWRTHTYKVLEQVEALTTAMVNQETGLRGYLLAGDPKFLGPYHAGSTAYDGFINIRFDVGSSPQIARIPFRPVLGLAGYALAVPAADPNLRPRMRGDGSERRARIFPSALGRQQDPQTASSGPSPAPAPMSVRVKTRYAIHECQRSV